MTRRIVDSGEMGDTMFWDYNNPYVPIQAVKFPCPLSDGEWVYRGAWLSAYGAGDGHPAVQRGWGGSVSGLYVRYRLYIDNIRQSRGALILGGLTVVRDGDGNIILEYLSWKFTPDDAYRFSFWAYYYDSVNPHLSYWEKVATTNICLQEKTWYMIEFRVMPTSVVAKIDGNEVINATWGFNVSDATLKFETNAYCTVYLDDIAADDADWIGDTTFVKADTVGDGTNSEWENSLDTGVNDYSFIDEYPYDNYVTYIKANMECATSFCERSDFTLENLDYTNREILGLWVETRATATDDQCMTCGYEMSLLTPVGIIAWIQHLDWTLGSFAAYVWKNCVTPYYPTNPDTGLAWTASDVDALQFAVRVREGYWA